MELRPMESSSGDKEENTEDIPGRKKSKLKALKTRLFGRSKRTGGEGNAELSQSASDITAEKGVGSEEDLVCSQGMMGSRALSHDSIFLADQDPTDTEPARVLSQENVHSKIKALQMKLQQQKMHLGPPPLVLPVRRPEDPGGGLEDDSCPEVSGADVTSQGVFSKTMFQPSSRPLSPIPKPAPTKYMPQFPSHPLPPPVSSVPSVVEPPSDFSSPAEGVSCLDTSAARHRMSVKPRNQRASAKKRLATTDSRLHSHTLNNIDHPESVEEEEQRLCAQDRVILQTERGEADICTTAQHLPSKSPEVAPIASEVAPKSSGATFSPQDHAPPGRASSVSSQLLRLKPQRPVNVTSSERSSFIEPELKSKREGDFEIQAMSPDKRNVVKKTRMSEDSSDQLPATSGSAVTLRPSSVPQQHQVVLESTRGIKRPAPGSGSFHFSITTAKNPLAERPRSSSFVGMMEQAEARHKTTGGAEEKPLLGFREKEELRDSQPRGSPLAVGRLKQDGAPPKCSVPWDRRDSLKKVEAMASASKNTTTDTGTLAGKEVEEAAEAQEEVQEEEGKTAFGIKLRSTSQTMRLRSDTTSKAPACADQCDKQSRQEVSANVGSVTGKLPANVSCASSPPGDVRVTDPTSSGSSVPVKNNLPAVGDSQAAPAELPANSSGPGEVETALAVPPEPQPVPQTASSEVSWVSMAMEKTRSLQQLFTSRFPRDVAGAQTAARAQAQPTNQTETLIGAQMQTPTAKTTTPVQAANQPPAATVRAASQALAAKPLLTSEQQKTSTTSAGVSREAQTSKQTGDSQSHQNTTQFASQCPSHPPVQTKAWTTQSPLRPSTQTETSSQFAQRSASQGLAQPNLPSAQQAPSSQPAPWSSRGLQPNNRLKPTATVSTTSSSATAPPPPPPPPPPVSALGRGEREANVQEKEGPSPSGRRAAWGGSVSEKAALLGKRADWTPPSGTKEVELKRAQTDVQTLDESPASTKTTPLSTDTQTEGKQGVKPRESSPAKDPDRNLEEKWLRKNKASSSPSSSPTQSSVLQSMSGSGQPSWMELAKRKSMAWSDKTMD